MTARVAERPGAWLDTEYGSIRRAGSASALFLPAAARLNWLLAGRAGALLHCQEYFDEAVGLPDVHDTLIRHSPGPNCTHLVVAAIYECASKVPAYIKVTPDSGSPITWATNDMTALARFEPWRLWLTTAPLAIAGAQAHRLEWDGVYVAGAYVWELPRAELAFAGGDVCVEDRDGAWAGVVYQRRITDSAASGPQALLQATRDARDGLRRHLPLLDLPTGRAWGLSSAGVWENIGDSAYGSSGFGFPCRQRRILATDTARECQVLARLAAIGGGTGDFRLTGSKGSAGTLGFGAAWAWYDCGTLDVAADADDLLVPEVQTSDGATTVYLAGIQLRPNE